MTMVNSGLNGFKVILNKLNQLNHNGNSDIKIVDNVISLSFHCDKRMYL